MKWLVIIGVLIVVCLGLAIIYGKYRWQIDTDNLRTNLASGRQTIKPKFYRQAEIVGLLRSCTSLNRELQRSWKSVRKGVENKMGRLWKPSCNTPKD